MKEELTRVNLIREDALTFLEQHFMNILPEEGKVKHKIPRSFPTIASLQPDAVLRRGDSIYIATFDSSHHMPIGSSNIHTEHLLEWCCELMGVDLEEETTDGETKQELITQ